MNEPIQPSATASTDRASWLGIAAGYTFAMFTWVAVVVIVFRQSIS